MFLQKFRKLKANIAKARNERNKFIKRLSRFIKSPSELKPININKNTQFDKILEAFCITRHQTKLISTTDYLSRPDLLGAKPKKDKQFEYSFKRGSTTTAVAYNLEDILIKGGIIDWIFGDMEFGGFVVPEVICEYVAQARRDDRIPDKSLPASQALLDKGKKYYEMLNDKTGLNKMSLFSMMGALWSEMAWAFENKNAQINTQERDGGKEDAKIKNGNVVAGTQGNSGCGEGWFGLTFWDQKTKIISELKALKSSGKLNDPAIDNLKNSESEYGTNGTMLVNCSDETWCKIIEIYLRKCQPRYGDILTAEDPDLEELLYASFLWKAGNFGDGVDLDSVDKTAKRYMETHEKQNKGNNPGYKAKNAFAQQIYAGIMLALYMESNEVTELEEIDNMLGV